MRQFGVTVGVGLIHLYRLVFAWLPSSCRFEPSCSRYSAACFQRFGFWRGAWLTLCRLSHCHPWHPGGLDPPPLPSPGSRR